MLAEYSSLRKINPDDFYQFIDEMDIEKFFNENEIIKAIHDTLEIPTPPLSPDSCNDSIWLNDDIGTALPTQTPDFIDDFDRGKLLGMTTDYTEYLDIMQKLVEEELKDNDCLWSGQCASWTNGQCRHSKRYATDDDSSAVSSLDESILNFVSTPVGFQALLSDLLPEIIDDSNDSCDENSTQVEGKPTIQYPWCDHSYFIRSPSPAPSSPASVKHEGTFLGIDTPSSESEVEIDVVSVPNSPAVIKSDCQSGHPVASGKKYSSGSRLLVSVRNAQKVKNNTTNAVNAANRVSTRKTKAKAEAKLNYCTSTPKKTNKRGGDDYMTPLRLTLKRMRRESENGKYVTPAKKSIKCKEITKNSRTKGNGMCNKSKNSFVVAPRKSRPWNNKDELTEEELEKKREHNLMEKNRRLELSCAYLKVNDLLDLQCTGRASKLITLRTCRERILELADGLKKSQKLKERLQRKQERLIAKLTEAYRLRGIRFDHVACLQKANLYRKIQR